MSELIMPKKYVCVLFVLLFGFAFLMTKPFCIVSPGTVGIQVLFGKVKEEFLTEGLNFINPISFITHVDVKLKTKKFDQAFASTKDMQIVHTDIVVNHHLNSNDVVNIYRNFGIDALCDRLLEPAIHESFKVVVAHYNSEELITKRDEVSTLIFKEISNKVNKYGIIINQISLVNFGFSPDYQSAIEKKVIATQFKLKAEEDLKRIEVESRQEIARAQGHAQSIKIQTEAINSHGGDAYVKLQAINKWNGQLPNVNGGVLPFIQVDK